MNSTATLTAPACAPRTAGSGRPWVAPQAWLALLICWLSLTALPAAAAPTGASWLCWYDEEISVLCRLMMIPLQASPVGAGEAADVSAPAGGPVSGDRLPAIVRQIRYHPASLQKKEIRIPLFTQPFDMGFVRQLAESVMCGTVTTCEVRFIEARGELALLLDELEDAS